MKYIFFVIVFILPFALNAQTEKGKMVIFSGMDLSAVFGKSSIKYDGNDLTEIKTKSINFEPGIGYFIANNVLLGLSAPLSFEKNGYNSINSKESIYGISLLGRYYFGKSKIKPFADLELGYLASKSVSEGYGADMNDTFAGMAYAGGAGLATFISEKVSFEFSINYAFSNLIYTEDKELTMNSNGFGFIAGFSIIL